MISLRGQVHSHRSAGVQDHRSAGSQGHRITGSQDHRATGSGSPVDVVGADLSAKRSGLLPTDARPIIAPQHRVNNLFLNLWLGATIWAVRWPRFCSSRPDSDRASLSSPIS
ncbi:hypothetical protein CU666_24135 [Pseudomonas syringae pv. actinidifoliorum]|nr:hypothetical protein [Pseudomonas syringae pv. actinidifoliorum]